MAETASILNSPHLWSCLNMKFELTNIFKNLFHQTQDKERAASGNWVLWKHESSNKRLYTFKGSLLEAMLCIHSSLWTSNYHHALCSRFSNRSLAQANTCHAMSLRRLVGTWWDHLPTSLFLLAKTDLRQVLKQSKYLSVFRLCEKGWEKGVVSDYCRHTLVLVIQTNTGIMGARTTQGYEYQ